MSYAGYLRRFAAQLIDCFLLTNIFMIPLAVLSHYFTLPNVPVHLTLATFTYFILVILLMNIVSYAYHILMTIKYGGTVGKLVLNMAVVDAHTHKFLGKKQTIYRVVVGYLFSSQFFGLGFLRMLVNPVNLGWHDELFDTRVILTNKSKAGLILLLVLILSNIAMFVFIIYNFSESHILKELSLYTQNILNSYNDIRGK